MKNLELQIKLLWVGVGILAVICSGEFILNG